VEAITTHITKKANNVAHPIAVDIKKSPSKFLLPSSITQIYVHYSVYTNKFKIKKPNRATVGFYLKS